MPSCLLSFGKFPLWLPICLAKSKMYWDISAYFSTALVDAAIIPVIADGTVFGRASALYEKLEKKKRKHLLRTKGLHKQIFYRRTHPLE